jgi:coenzyme F420 hydrogenase subunit delta
MLLLPPTLRTSKVELEKHTGNLDTMHKDIIVLGCGNILFGDDGFGSSVADHIEKCGLLPENVSVINAGTSVREILFDLILEEQKPRKIIVIDAVDANRKSGEIFRIDIEEIPQNKVDDFALHGMPTSNLLRELRDFCHVEVIIIAGQVESIPDVVRPGLSDALARGVSVAVEEVLTLCDESRGKPV